MRHGIALCHHLWRNAVPCDEALVMADAQEDQGFDRSAEVTEEHSGDGIVSKNGHGFGSDSGDGNGNGDGEDYGFGCGFGTGSGDADALGAFNGTGDGGGSLVGSGVGFREGYNTNFTWKPGMPYPFPKFDQEDFGFP